MRHVLVVSSWGYPGSWYPAVYSYRGVVEEARTSLGAIVASYLEEGYSVGALVLAPDTLASSLAPRNCLGELGGLWLCDPSEAGDYSELVERVKKQVEGWIRECSGSASLERLLRENSSSGVRVEVVSSLGRFKGCGDYWVFAEPPRRGVFEPVSAYTGEAILALLEALLETKPEKLVVDLTHGVNFMPMSLARASETAAIAYTLSSRSELELELVNSEPYPTPAPREPSRPPSLEVHVVYAARYAARRVLEEASLRVIENRDKLAKKPVEYLASGERAAEVGREASSLVKWLRRIGEEAIAAALIALYNMPLAAFYLSKELRSKKPLGSTFLEEAAKTLRGLKKLAIEYGEVARRERVVYPGLAFKGGRVEVLVLASALLDYIAGIEPPSNVETRGASLEELRIAARELASLYKPIAFSEIDSLEECTASSCVVPARRREWPGELCTSRSISSMDPRNLRAHAGLEKNIVEMMLAESPKENRIRYRLSGDGSPLCWKQLLDNLARSPRLE